MRPSGRTATEVARELGISSESLRGWVKKSRAAQDAVSLKLNTRPRQTLGFETPADRLAAAVASTG
ncbi:transposase [Streptomyces sp. bgisy060]|uniref:transposase n=1 Tax=Streptomyces sp. bgisy060 TaxID=3413775 RepID=UPI003EBCDF74